LGPMKFDKEGGERLDRKDESFNQGSREKLLPEKGLERPKNKIKGDPQLSWRPRVW